MEKTVVSAKQQSTKEELEQSEAIPAMFKTYLGYGKNARITATMCSADRKV